MFPILRRNHVDDRNVSDVLLAAWSWRLVGVLASGHVDPAGHHLRTSLNDLVARSRHVVVGAWDGEGLLVVDRV